MKKPKLYNIREVKTKQLVPAFLKQLFFPLRCPVCDDIVTPFGEKICPDCVGRLRLLTQPYCMKCGKKLRTEGELCADCSKKKHHYVRGRALYEYETVAPSVYRLKYSGRQEYAGFFGEELGYYLGDFIRQTGAEALIPVPLHKKRFRKRGYNQAALIAGALGRYLDLPVYENYVYRVRNTVPLKLLNPKERQNNLKKAFIIGKNDVKLKTVILVDDIYTTGSTMDEIAQTLKSHGVERVYFVALACGIGV